MHNLFDLTGSTAIVTGAATGIGQGIALALAAAGARIAGVGRSPMTETQRRIEQQGGAFRAINADLATIEPVERIIDEAAAWNGHVDILVNNAGIIRRADALEFTERDCVKAAARSSTSLRSCRFREVSGFRPTRRAKAASRGSRVSSPANGPPRASTSTRSHRAIS